MSFVREKMSTVGPWFFWLYSVAISSVTFFLIVFILSDSNWRRSEDFPSRTARNLPLSICSLNTFVIIARSGTAKVHGISISLLSSSLHHKRASNANLNTKREAWSDIHRSTKDTSFMSHMPNSYQKGNNELFSPYLSWPPQTKKIPTPCATSTIQKQQ